MNLTREYSTASLKLTKNRGLLFYAVSLLNPLHRHGHLVASVEAIEGLIHPETRRPSLVIHVTDAIYAFNFMTENPDLPYEDARNMALAAGDEWIEDNLYLFTSSLGFTPVIFRWSHWDVEHQHEYNDALGHLHGVLAKPEFHEFQSAVKADVDRFVARTIKKRTEQGLEVNSRWQELIQANCHQFVLHENAGYVLIGRHIVADYLAHLRATEPDYATVIEAHGGLMDGAIRLYPGGQLKSIEWLQKHRKQLPQSLWGAERITPIEIEFKTYCIGVNEYASMTRKEILFRENLKKAKKILEQRWIQKPA